MRFFGFLRGRSGMFAAFAALLLAACTVVVEDGPGPRPPRPDGPPPGCTREYDPVCAVRGNDRRTFGNACVARSEGYRVVRQGECRGPDRPPQQACTFEYRPVCAVRGNDRRTFGNACQARVDGYQVIRDGECRQGGGGGWGGGGGGGRPPERACTREYAPVCARRGRDVRTFGNACMADEADYEIIRRGAC